MSRMATSEYIGARRRAYASADRAKRIRILDEVCETTGYKRKYANRLLTGSRKFREHRGRGRTYGEEIAEALRRVWLEAGWSRGNRRSGRGGRNEVKKGTPCAAGGRAGGHLRPRRGRSVGQHATLEALGHVEGRFPFAITSLHSDNGGEILNHHVCAYLGGKPKRPFLWRSRPRRCNDNARGEAALRRGPAGLPGPAGRACQAVRRLVGLQELLLPLQDDRREEETQRREGICMQVRHAQDAVPADPRRARALPGSGIRAQGVQGGADRHGPLPARPQAPAEDTAHAGGVRQGEANGPRHSLLRGEGERHGVVGPCGPPKEERALSVQ